MSLVGGWFLPAIVVAAVVAAVVCVPWEQPVRWRVLVASVVLAATLTGVVVAVVDGTGVLPWPVPWSFDVWLGGIVLTLALGALAWRYLRWRRLLAPVALVLSVLAAASLVNANYQYFPTFRSLFGTPADASSMHTVIAERGRREQLPHGAVVQVAIPGRVSHFHAREGYVWLPPAYLADPRLSLPVVELLAGTPGYTLDWIRGGDAGVTADFYARRHGGVAPLIVMPDDNGSTAGDTECVDSPRGRAETYLTVDVPAYMRAVFQAATGPDSLAVAGLSEGGMCAVMLALRHPDEYRAFGDFSGLAAPTTGAGVSPGPTSRALFGGSARAYADHDPATLLRGARFPELAGWFEVGSDDPACEQAQSLLVPLARRAGVDTVADTTRGGGHDFTEWALAFRQSLPFLAARLSTGRAA